MQRQQNGNALYLELLDFRWPEHRVETRVAKAGAQESVGTCHLSPRQRATFHGTPEPYPGAGFHSHPLGLISLLPPAAAAGTSPQQEAPVQVAAPVTVTSGGVALPKGSPRVSASISQEKTKVLGN